MAKKAGGCSNTTINRLSEEQNNVITVLRRNDFAVQEISIHLETTDRGNEAQSMQGYLDRGGCCCCCGGGGCGGGGRAGLGSNRLPSLKQIQKKRKKRKEQLWRDTLGTRETKRDNKKQGHMNDQARPTMMMMMMMMLMMIMMLMMMMLKQVKHDQNET